MEPTFFEGFAGVWTPVVPARELGARPLGVKLAGEPVALFRDGRGGVGALLDRCPHRGVRLSLGSVNEQGELACPFHGWCFDGQGACTRVPLDPSATPRGAVALPAREAGGLVWVYTGAEAPAGPDVPDAFVEPGWSRWIYYEDWACHWTRAMENMLDMPHVPFVHRRTIRRRLRAQLREDSAMRIHLEETAAGFRIRSVVDGVDVQGHLEWRRPNGMVLWIMPGSPPERGFRQHVFCIPIDASTTRLMVVSTRTFLRYNPLGWLSDQFNRVIVTEDRAVVESSQPAIVPPPAEETSVATDAPTLYFRRWYHRTLASGGAPLVPAARLQRRRTAAPLEGTEASHAAG